VAGNAERGLEADTNRRLQEIDAGLASLYSELAVSRARETAGARGRLAGTRGQQALSARQFGDKMFDLETTSFQGPTMDFGGLGTELGGLLQMAFARQPTSPGGAVGPTPQSLQAAGIGAAYGPQPRRLNFT
jgi:hypothetical protein